MNKIDENPRIPPTQDPNFTYALVTWIRSVAVTVNAQTDAINAMGAAIADLTARVEALEAAP